MYRGCGWLFLVALQASLASTIATADINNTDIKLNIPKSLPLDATSILDRALGSLSIELSCE